MVARRLLVSTYRQARRLVVFVVGATIVVFGIVLFFLPGPALIVIPIGLAVLATEYAWARRLLDRMKDNATSLAHGVRNGFRRRPHEEAEPSRGERGKPGAEVEEPAAPRFESGSH